MEYFAVALAWLVPGAGHFVIGEKARGVVFALAIHWLFAVGLLVGGLKVLNPSDQLVWGYAQYLAGWPMLVAYKVAQLHPEAPASFGKVADVGIVYCGIAGMLNLLVIFDALVRATSQPRVKEEAGATGGKAAAAAAGEGR